MSAPGQELELVVSGKDLLKRLFEDAIRSRNADRAADYLDVIERIFPRMHKPYGKVRAFVWPEMPQYEPQITAEVIEQRFDNAVAALQTDETTVLQVTPTYARSARFAELFDDTITLDPAP